MSKKQVIPPDKETADSCLGSTYLLEGEYDKAIKYYHQALELKIKAYENSPNHSDIATSYNNLGSAYANIASEYQSLELHAEALSMQRKDANEEQNATIEVLESDGTDVSLGGQQEGSNITEEL